MSEDTRGGWLSNWRSTRRSFVQGLGATAGFGAVSGRGAAQTRGPSAPTAATYHVSERNGQYRVVDGATGNVVFNARADRNAEAAFQHAVDRLPERGGTVVASGDVFRFGAPVTIGDGTALVGSRGTRFVTSQVGERDDPIPTEQQENPLPVGHDLVRVRGDGTVVSGIEFDGNGTQLGSHAVQADEASDVVIANNRTVDGFQMALSFSGCEGVMVRGNHVSDPNWYGITSRAAPAGGDRDLKRSTDVVVAENRVSGMKFNNIATYNVGNFAVVGNVALDGGHSLIACSPAQHGTVVGNVCRDLDVFGGDPGGEAGIEIEYKATHVRDSVAGTPEETSFDITVSGNHVENCEVGFIARTVPATAGDEAARLAKRPYGFTVTGNAINGCGTGVLVRSGDSGVVATNTLRDNDRQIAVADEFTDGLQRGLNATRS